MFLNLSFEGRIYMSQTGTPTEFLGLGITEPDDTLNVLVDLNGQWQKIDTGVKNVDTKANTNASGISALNTAVQDNTENITNILETNVNQQNSIDTLQTKVATLEQDDTDYGTRITAVEAGVQENSELINDLEVELSGVETSVGTVPSGSTLQGQVDGLDTRVTTLENSGSVSALETRVTTLETEVGTVPAGETVQGQITTLNGQVNSGNIPFRFSVDGGGNYGYLKADDSFVPFSSGDPTSINGHNIITVDYNSTTINPYASSFLYYSTSDASSSYYNKLLYIPTLELIDLSSLNPNHSHIKTEGEIATINGGKYYYNRQTNNLVEIQNAIAICSGIDSLIYYTKGTNTYTRHYIDLIDSTNNTDKVFTLPSDKLQSTAQGKRGMLFHAYNASDPANHYCFTYYDVSGKVVRVMETTFDESYTYTTHNSEFYSSLSHLYPNELIGNNDGFHVDSDTIYYTVYNKYIRIGNKYIELK